LNVFPPLAAVEGWILMVTNIHEEASEEDLVDKFSEYGRVCNVALNLDRRTGYAKGYGLVEFASKKESDAAIAGQSGKALLGKIVTVEYAFVQDTPGGGRGGGAGTRRER
jgi:RNA-binding protein 8A